MLKQGTLIFFYMNHIHFLEPCGYLGSIFHPPSSIFHQYVIKLLFMVRGFIYHTLLAMCSYVLAVIALLPDKVLTYYIHLIRPISHSIVSLFIQATYYLNSYLQRTMTTDLDTCGSIRVYEMYTSIRFFYRNPFL